MGLVELELEVRLVEDGQSADAPASPPHAAGPVPVSRRPGGGAVEADARELVRRLQRACLGHTLSVNQLGVFRCAGAPGVALRVRVVQADTLDAADRVRGTSLAAAHRLPSRYSPKPPSP